jgi:hypothetical protein
MAPSPRAPPRGVQRGPHARAGGSERWGDVLQGFWGPFRDNLAQVAGVSMTDVIDVLDERLGAHFFPQACPLQEVCQSASRCLPGSGVIGAQLLPPQACPLQEG